MAELPYIPIYVDALLADTSHLSNEEFGAYHRLLYAMWRRDGALPNDSTDLMRITGTPARRWPRLWQRLSPFFKRNERGDLVQKRLQKVLEKSRVIHGSNVAKMERARAAKAAKHKGSPAPHRSMTASIKEPVAAPVTETIKDHTPYPEKDRALPIKKAERSIQPKSQDLSASSGEIVASGLPPASVASPGLEGRSLPAPSEGQRRLAQDLKRARSNANGSATEPHAEPDRDRDHQEPLHQPPGTIGTNTPAAGLLGALEAALRAAKPDDDE